MCYTTDEYADPKDETTYEEKLPYGTDGYRTNCNDIEVKYGIASLVNICYISASRSKQ